nr:uncharacterized protein LOC127299335 isoform X3 [Lolium perenne]XP_051185243.1 uncharacterized protein LOC127299335 isoform X4 [Lolium perenne]
MDVHPVRYELDFEDLKATEGYNPPHDFLIRVLPLDAGGALPGGGETREMLWYEYPSPFDWDLQLQEESDRQLQLEEECLWRSLEERERQGQQLEVTPAAPCGEGAAAAASAGQPEQRQRRKKSHMKRLDVDERWQVQDVLYLEDIWANSSTTECWGLDHETPLCSSSSPSRDASKSEEHQFLDLEEHQVHVRMYEYDGASIPRYCLFKSEANTQELLLGFPLKIPYIIYAGRCNLKLQGYKLRYADLFPSFHKWNYTWVRPTTYEGDDQYVYFFRELLAEAEYTNTKDRVLAKAIAIANKAFRKMLYFQIELAVGDCMMLLEEKEKFQQRCNLYGYVASEIYFKNQKYESVLERVKHGHEGLCYELTEFGRDANEDDAWEMRAFVDHLVRSAPIELPSTTRSNHVYKKWVSEQITVQFDSYFHLYLNYLVEKINMAQDLDLAPEDTSL